MLDALIPQNVSAYGPTASPQLAKPTSWGTLPLDDLRRSLFIMPDGPTGTNHYWPEWFAFIHPDLATTDIGFNHVDAVWVPHAVCMRVIVDPITPTLEPLDDALKMIRECSGLPAIDVAAMIGVKRRQFYNLLNGERASSDRERWIRSLAAVLSALRDAADGDTARVRASILRPLDDGRSLFELARDRDQDSVLRAKDELVLDLRAGRVTGLVQRPSPTLRARSDHTAAREFLSEYREPEDRD